jgi:hypothetical protein
LRRFVAQWLAVLQDLRHRSRSRIVVAELETGLNAGRKVGLNAGLA